jgi:hypothetical protein
MIAKETPIEQKFRGRTRAELVSICYSILEDLTHHNAVLNSAERLADLFVELTGNHGVESVDNDPIHGPPEEIGTGLYRMADGEEVGGEPENLSNF